MRHLDLKLLEDGGAPRAAQIAIRDLVIAGWTGRNKEALEKHIAELEALGVKRPETVPVFYRVAASRLTTDVAIEVLGSESSGEVEFVLLKAEGRLWVGAGSDHTDRKVEAYNVSVSKQVCDKPITDTFWAFEEVRDHWDELILRSYVFENGARRLYQEGKVTAMLHPEDLIARYGGLEDGTMMFCGTLSVKGEIAGGERFAFELEDPVRKRSIKGGYALDALPLMG
jgi:hypothetical protein